MATCHHRIPPGRNGWPSPSNMIVWLGWLGMIYPSQGTWHLEDLPLQITNWIYQSQGQRFANAADTLWKRTGNVRNVRVRTQGGTCQTTTLGMMKAKVARSRQRKGGETWRPWTTLGEMRMVSMVMYKMQLLMSWFLPSSGLFHVCSRIFFVFFVVLVALNLQSTGLGILM